MGLGFCEEYNIILWALWDLVFVESYCYGNGVSDVDC